MIDERTRVGGEMRPIGHDLDGGEVDNLASFLFAYMASSHVGEHSSSFRQLVLASEDLRKVSATIFLLYHVENRETERQTVHSFIYRTMPILIHQLKRSMKSQRMVLNGRVRGRIDWSSTIKVRAGANGDAHDYACFTNQRQFDLPENQVVKYLLMAIHNCLESVLPSLGSWRIWGRKDSRGIPQVGEVGIPLATQVRFYLNSVYLRDVTTSNNITAQQVHSLRSSKNDLYRRVASLYDLYQDIVCRPVRQRWFTALKEPLPLPPGTETIGERILDYLHDNPSEKR